MTIQLIPAALHSATTQAAEGLPRRCWTVAELRHMLEAGILLEDERFELIGGEVVPMSPKGSRHEMVKRDLILFWAKVLPADITMIPETTLYIDEKQFLEPDFLIWPKAIPIEDVSAEVAYLIVEVADSSLHWDIGRKSRIYASIGLREYWVIDAVRLVTHVHRGLTDAGYASVERIPFERQLVPSLVPAMAVTLRELGLSPLRDGD